MYFGQGIEAVSAAKTKACPLVGGECRSRGKPGFCKAKMAPNKNYIYIERNVNMSDTSKFLADIQRIKKHVRADNGGKYDGRKVCEQISSLFASSNRNAGDLARSIADYWLNSYIFASADVENEPSQENIDRITVFQNFLDGDSDEDYSILTGDDWETLKDFCDDEAENLDLDSLQNFMSIILDNGAL